MKDYMLKLYHKKRNNIINYLGGKCAVCGSQINLHIDHIDHNSKKFNLAKIWSYSWEKIVVELDKCHLLCKICHLKKTKTEGSLTKSWSTKPRIIHGTYWTYYRHKCRCEQCDKARRDRLEARRLKKVMRRLWVQIPSGSLFLYKIAKTF